MLRGICNSKKEKLEELVGLLYIGQDVCDLVDNGIIDDKESEKLESVRKYVNSYNNFIKAKTIGITLNSSDFTKEEIDAFFIIEKKLADLGNNDGK